MILLTELLDTYLGGSYCDINITVLPSDDGIYPEEDVFIKGIGFEDLQGIDSLSCYCQKVKDREKMLNKYINLSVQTFWESSESNTLFVILKRGI